MDGARPMNGAHQSHRSAKFKIQQRLHHIKYKAVAYSDLKEQSICKKYGRNSNATSTALIIHTAIF